MGDKSDSADVAGRKQSATMAVLAASGQPLILMRETDTTIALANQPAADAFGCSQDELAGANLKQLFADEESFVAFAAKLYGDGGVDSRDTSLNSLKEGREPFRARLTARLGVHDDEQVAAIAIELPDNKSPLSAIAREQLDRDMPTGLFSRAYFLRIARHELERALRYERTLTLALVELDGFAKQLKKLGQDASQAHLREVASVCQGCVRDLDIVSRYRDDAFVVLLPETGLKGAKQVFERMRAAVEDAKFGKSPSELTASIGFSELLPTDDAIADLLERADKALYRAVEAGRNAVKVA